MSGRVETKRRRDVLRGGLVLSGGTLGKVAAVEAATKGARHLSRGRRIETAIATICCDGFGDEDFRYTFDYVPKLGIKNVEFNVWYARNLTMAGLDGIRRRCLRHGLRPISLQASGFVADTDSADVAREVSRMMWLIEGCRRLGCRIIKCTGAKRGTRGGLAGIIEVLKEAAPAAEQAGVIITLENHKDNNLEFPDDYQKVFDSVPSRAIGVCLDMGHFNASGVAMDEFIDRFHERIYHLDVKDNVGPGTAKFVRYGTGAVPMRSVIERCIEKGYRGYLVLELSLQDHATVLDDLRAGQAITKSYET